MRQAKRMSSLADKFKKDGNYVVADFVCPTPEARQLFNPDFIIWVDTIKKGRFEDTNQMFIAPTNFNVRVTEKNSELWALNIVKILKGM